MKLRFALLILAAGIARADVNSIITYPGGNNGSVQTNKSGRFNGDAYLTYSTSTKVLSVPGVSISSLTANGLTYTFPATQTGGFFLQNNGAGGLSWQTPSNFSVSTGTALAVFDGNIRISSPTSAVIFSTAQFIITLQGATTALISVDPSSVTLMGQMIDISAGTNLAVAAPITMTGDTIGIDPSSATLLGPSISLTTEVTGVLPAANLPPTIVYDNTTQTISGVKTFTSSITVTHANGIKNTYGIVTGSVTAVDAFFTNTSITSGTVSSTLVVGSTFSVVGGTTILRGVTYHWPTAQASGSKVLSNDGSGILSWASGSSGGVTVYAATATASFPFGFSASTGVFTQSLNGSVKSVVIASGSATYGFYSDPDYFQIFNTNNSRGCIGFSQSDDNFSSNPPWSICRIGTGLSFGFKSLTGGSASLLQMDTDGSYPTGSTVTVNVPLIASNAIITESGINRFVNGTLGTVGNYVATFSTDIAGPYTLAVSTTGLVSATRLTGAGLSTCGDSTHALGWSSTNNLFTCQSVTGSGGGGSSTLAVTTGTFAGFAGTISSPTAVVNFHQSQFKVRLAGGATAFVEVDPSSVTLLGQSIDISANTNLTASGSANMNGDIVNVGPIKIGSGTIGAFDVTTTSASATGIGGLRSNFGFVGSTLALTAMTVTATSATVLGNGGTVSNFGFIGSTMALTAITVTPTSMTVLGAGGLTVNSLTASNFVMTDANKALVSQATVDISANTNLAASGSTILSGDTIHTGLISLSTGIVGTLDISANTNLAASGSANLSNDTINVGPIRIGTGTIGPFDVTSTSASVTGVAGASVKYLLAVGSMTGAGLSTCGDATHGLGWSSTDNLFTCASITGSGGSAGSSTLAVATGTVTTFTGVISSPTAVVKFDQSVFAGSLQGGATAFVTIAAGVSAVSANFTAASTSTVILADATGGSLTVTLPTAVGITGRVYRVKRTNSGANTVTVATTSSQTIDGDLTQIMTVQYTSIDVISDGANWSIL